MGWRITVDPASPKGEGEDVTSVVRRLIMLAAILVLATAPDSSPAQSLKQPAKQAAKPSARPAPPAPKAAPRTAVETNTIPAFVPPGPPPIDENGLHQPVVAMLKAVQTMNPDADLARWIDGGPCWVWVGMKRDQPWAKYRFAYQGACKQGRADGQGVLKVESQESAGKWTPVFDLDTLFQNGIPLADPKSGAESKLVIGLPDRTVLSWMGSSLNEVSEVFTVGQADDQGRVSPCTASPGILAVQRDNNIDAKQYKHLLRRAASVVGSQCQQQQQMRARWLTTLVAAEGLTLTSRQGFAIAEPVLAQAEIRDGLIYAYGQDFPSPPSLIAQASPVPGAAALAWTPPVEELDYQLLMVVALPVLLLLLLLAGLRMARSRNRQYDVAKE